MKNKELLTARYATKNKTKQRHATIPEHNCNSISILLFLPSQNYIEIIFYCFNYRKRNYKVKTKSNIKKEINRNENTALRKNQEKEK